MSQKSSLAKQCLYLNIITIDKYSAYVNYLNGDTSSHPLTRTSIYDIFKDNLINYFLKIVLKKRLLQYLKYSQYFNTVNYVPKSQNSDA
jgi:hypothetical protein